MPMMVMSRRQSYRVTEKICLFSLILNPKERRAKETVEDRLNQ
jgi:hypothetical protein